MVNKQLEKIFSDICSYISTYEKAVQVKIILCVKSLKGQSDIHFQKWTLWPEHIPHLVFSTVVTANPGSQKRSNVGTLLNPHDCPVSSLQHHLWLNTLWQQKTQYTKASDIIVFLKNYHISLGSSGFFFFRSILSGCTVMLLLMLITGRDLHLGEKWGMKRKGKQEGHFLLRLMQ